MRRRKYEWDLPEIEHELKFAKSEFEHSLAKLCEGIDNFRLKQVK